jgi:hypothetical protein
MRRALLSTSLLSLALLLIGATAAAAASLTRIETRPFYGASVTIEEGVRVYRALPPERHVIINPDGKTPLNLTIEERNITVNQHQYLYQYSAGDGGGGDYYDGGYYDGGYGYGGLFYDGLRGRHRGRHHFRSDGRGHMINVPRAIHHGGRGGGGGGRGR